VTLPAAAFASSELAPSRADPRLRNVFAKLGVSSRVEVARLVERERRAG
jgi:hypothetical protein